MIELILVGDVHAVPSELEECGRLLSLCEQVHVEHPTATFVFLGDQTHTNDAMSVRVMEFWREAAVRLSTPGRLDGRPWFIVGNHDQVFPGTKESAMSACRDVARVVDEAQRFGPVQLVAYSGDAEVFGARATGGGMLICHQDFAGAIYDSGIRSRSRLVAPDGFAQIVSGHLHVPQERGSVWYPGSPRWRSASDASVTERAIWWIEVAEDGQIARRMPYSTSKVCRRVVQLVDREGGEQLELVHGADNRVRVEGSAEYVRSRREQLVQLGAQVRGVVVRRQEVRVRESEGVVASLGRHLETFQSKTDRAVLRQMLRERLNLELA